MTDHDANPTKPRPHGRVYQCQRCGQWPCRCKWPREATPDRTYLDREQHVPAETIAEFTKKYGEWKP